MGWGYRYSLQRPPVRVQQVLVPWARWTAYSVAKAEIPLQRGLDYASSYLAGNLLLDREQRLSVVQRAEHGTLVQMVRVYRPQLVGPPVRRMVCSSSPSSSGGIPLSYRERRL
jgi:hypothetical protein